MNVTMSTSQPVQIELLGEVHRAHKVVACISGTADADEVASIAKLIRTVPGVLSVELRLGAVEPERTFSYWHKNPLRRLLRWFSDTIKENNR
jgi:DNA-binding transcriptional LysR family regulator